MMEAGGSAAHTHWKEDGPEEHPLPQKQSDLQPRVSIDLPLHMTCCKCHHWHNKHKLHLSKDPDELMTARCEKCRHKMFGLGNNSTQSTFASQETQMQSPRSSIVCNNRPTIVLDTSHAGLPNNTVDPLAPIVERSPVSDVASDRFSAASLRRSHSSRRAELSESTAQSTATPVAQPSPPTSIKGPPATHESIPRITSDERTTSNQGGSSTAKKKSNYFRKSTAKVRKVVGAWKERLSNALNKQNGPSSAHASPDTPVKIKRRLPSSASVASSAASLPPEVSVLPDTFPNSGAVTEQPGARPAPSPELVNNPSVANEARYNERDNSQSHGNEQKHQRIVRKRQEKTQEERNKVCRCDRFCHCMRGSSGDGDEHSERSLSSERIPDHRLPFGVEALHRDADGNHSPDRASTGSPDNSARPLPRSATRVSFVGIGGVFNDQSRPSSRDTLSFSIGSWDGTSPPRPGSVGAYSSQAPTVVSLGSQGSVMQSNSSGGVTTSRPQTPGLLTDGLTAGHESDGDDHTPTQSRPSGRVVDGDTDGTPTRSHSDRRHLDGETSESEGL